MPRMTHSDGSATEGSLVERQSVYENTHPDEAPDELLRSWLIDFVDAVPRWAPPGSHRYEGPLPSPSTVRDALSAEGFIHLPVVTGPLDVSHEVLGPDHRGMAPDHITRNDAHNLFHRLGGKHR